MTPEGAFVPLGEARSAPPLPPPPPWDLLPPSSVLEPVFPLVTESSPPGALNAVVPPMNFPLFPLQAEG
ncbi:MAG: hypothetical protein H7831_14345, partial [Magnetococcus sp. WYHC-3]